MDLCDEVGMEVEGMGDGERENERGWDFDPPQKTKYQVRGGKDPEERDFRSMPKTVLRT